MNALKIFALSVSIIVQLRNVIAPIAKYDHAKAVELFRKLCRLLEIDISETNFIHSVDKWLDLYVRIVDLLWFISPETFHRLTWKLVEVERRAWRWGVEMAQKYLSEYINFDPDLDKKMNEAIHQYNLRVLDHLIWKDVQVELKQFDRRYRESVERAIEEARRKELDGAAPEGTWLYYRDHSGLYKNEKLCENINVS